MNNIDFLDVGFCILMFFLGICAVIFSISYVRDSYEKDCVKFFEEHNGYVLKSCKKYSDGFGDLINVDV